IIYCMVRWRLVCFLPAGFSSRSEGGTNDQNIACRLCSCSPGDTKGKTRQDTGMSDPSVNPGQASGMRVVLGEVKQASPKTIVIENSKGKETTMSLDAATAGDRDVRPGDIVTGTITGQGDSHRYPQGTIGHRAVTSPRSFPGLCAYCPTRDSLSDWH